MFYPSMFTYVFVILALIQFDVHFASRSCDHPWKNGFSLNGTVQDFLNDVKDIYSGLVKMKFPDPKDREEFKFIFNKCARSAECSLYTMMDIKKEGSMSLCVVVNKSLNFPFCSGITCTCNKKEKRDIHTSVDREFTRGSKGIQLESASCYITNKKHAHWPVPFSEQHRTTKKVAKVQRKTNNIQDNTSLKEISRDRQDAKDKDHGGKKEKTWVFVIISLMGILFGILVGFITTCLFLKRKGSKINKTKSVLNSINYMKNCNSDDLGQLEVKEYSEIPEHFKENRSEQTGEIEILEHSEANTCEINQCSSIIGECMKQDTIGDKPGRDFEDNVCLTQNVFQEEKNNQYHCIADISSVTQNYFSLESRKSETPKQDTTSENHTDGDALYFILSKQLSISDIDKDRSETENEDRKIQQSNGAKKPGSSGTEVLLKSSDYAHEKENLHVEP
ncbi:uncharacterized protein LOC111105840 isoform X2 [Crassostrea virginica]